jgi:hypothetical protein
MPPRNVADDPTPMWMRLLRCVGGAGHGALGDHSRHEFKEFLCNRQEEVENGPKEGTNGK